MALLGVTLTAVLAVAALATGCSKGQDLGNPSARPSGSAIGAATELTAQERSYLDEKGTLKVGAFSDYPPIGYADEAGQAAGISAALWQLIAQHLGTQVELVPRSLADQIEGLKSGEFDSLAGIDPLPERSKWFAFTKPYLPVETSMFVEPRLRGKVESLDDLKGLTVAVVKDDSGQVLADKAGLKTLVVPGYAQAVKAVASGKAQAAILDQPVGEYYSHKLHLTKKVRNAGPSVAQEALALPVRKDDKVLLSILNKAVRSISNDEMMQIYNEEMNR